MAKTRIGLGYDVHPLVSGRELWLGGIRIEHDKGCLGHSDADVLIHAICDALLGAASLRDIGHHFPNTDPRFKGADSKTLLKQVGMLVKEAGYEIGNIDATLAIEQPKINPHISRMQQVMAEVLGIPSNDISIKATTNEGLGYVGTEKGVNAWAVALIYAGNK
ncbi:MAG: 2-C-methyl-D-erythritol 2,4-cyclodiphosphate synthase [Bacteroidia bacterium]